ncbi:MAG TPA: carbon-phosphorus lyase complex subunit PhnI, partial [Eoetvoesiella sp.]
RLLDFSLLAEGDKEQSDPLASTACDTLFSVPSGTSETSDTSDTSDGDAPNAYPRVIDILAREGLIGLETDTQQSVPDITREPLDFPAGRAQRLQALARADEGFLLALGYSTQRGYGRNHPFAGEIRIGTVEVWIEPEELDFAVPAGVIEITECEMINQFVGSKDQPPQFTRGYGLAFGHAERKAMGMALVDRALRAPEYNESVESPAQQEEFVLMHCDNVESAGFVSHLKLPHYVDFQSELELIRKLRRSPGGAVSDIQEKQA